MYKRSHFSPPAVGGSSLLIIFAVLCLTIFSLLCLSTVQADTRLSNVSADAVSAYYEADCAAEQIFAQLRSGEHPACVTITDNTYTYTCPISDTQELQVSISEHNGTWTINQWQAVSVADWQADETLSVWDGTV